MTLRDSIRRAHLSGPPAEATESATLEFRFAADDPTFAGHFPTRPLLPGVFQLEMARFAAELLLKCPLAVREITKAKFLRPIIPAETVRVELKLSEKPDTMQLRARFYVGGQPAGETILEVTQRK
jgi:3-hydroxyacyl-[acyl-carrier-protein] dehydratase